MRRDNESPTVGKPSDSDHLLINLLLVAHAAGEWALAVGSSCGLNFHQLILLFHLLEGPQRLKDLSSKTGQPKTRVGMQLTALVNKSLCQKSRRAGSDGRAVFYELTKDGGDVGAAVRAALGGVADATRSRVFPRESAIAGWLETCATELRKHGLTR